MTKKKQEIKHAEWSPINTPLETNVECWEKNLKLKDIREDIICLYDKTGLIQYEIDEINKKLEALSGPIIPLTKRKRSMVQKRVVK